MTPWGENDLWLFTPGEYEQLPDGTELTSIMGDIRVKGQDDIDQDVRFGHLAWGVRNPLTHEHRHLFTLFGLKQ